MTSYSVLLLKPIQDSDLFVQQRQTVERLQGRLKVRANKRRGVVSRNSGLQTAESRVIAKKTSATQERTLQM
jgi:hypothetical protein